MRQYSSERESLYARVFHLSPVAIAITTLRDGRFIEVNESLLRQLGYSSAEVSGRTSLELGMWFDPEDRRKVVDMLLGQGSVQDLEVRLRTKAGEQLVVLASLERITLDDQDCILAMFQDVSDRVRLGEARLTATLEERQRLARELHDSVTQSLYSLTLFSEATRRLLKTGDLPEAKDYLRRVNETARQSLKEMRLLLYELRPGFLEGSLVAALQHRLEAVEKRSGVNANLFVHGLGSLPASLEDVLYRITQEALNNALKHAAASLVTVNLSADSTSICLEVTDNGRGFDVESLSHSGGMGLSSLRERVASLGGIFVIQSQPDQGTTIKLTVPQP